VADSDGDGFGNADDALIPGGNSAIVARIASVIIGGSVTGSAADGDHFGFVAEAFGKTKINIAAGTTDVAIRQVSATPIA
jgi:predicted TIM-barrel enzyme